LGTDPGAVVDSYWTIPARKSRIAIVMIAYAKKHSLRDTAFLANGHRFEVQDEYFLPDQTMIADGEPPREVDIHSRLDINILPNFRTKYPGKPPSPSRWPGQGAEEEDALHAVPNKFEPKGAASIKFASWFIIMMMDSRWHG
jgi:hypothetical protein